MPETQDPDFLDRQQELFTGISSRYDLVNHLMTGWRDHAWRRFAVKQLRIPPSANVLDIGSGNGQLAQEILRQHPDSHPVASDLTQSMLEVGLERDKTKQISWVQTNALSLPFDDGQFDSVISGFLVRNLSDLTQALLEQYRVLKPGGRIAILETCRPPRHILGPLLHYYMNTIIPVLGGMITGFKDAYTYLNKSTAGFMRPEELAAFLASLGFRKVAYREFAFGVVAVHWGEK